MITRRELPRELVPTPVEVQPMERDVALSAFNAFLGIWLVASSFLWTHSTANLVNSIVLGLACIGIALLTLRLPIARWLFVPLSAWMAASAWILPLRDTTSSVTLVAIATALLLSPLTERYLGQDDPREVIQNPDDA